MVGPHIPLEINIEAYQILQMCPELSFPPALLSPPITSMIDFLTGGGGAALATGVSSSISVSFSLPAVSISLAACHSECSLASTKSAGRPVEVPSNELRAGRYQEGSSVSHIRAWGSGGKSFCLPEFW